MGTGTISQSRAVKMRKKLLNMGYLHTFTVLGTGRSGKAQCEVITEKAGMGMAKKPRGGDPHAFWCYRIGEFYKRKGTEVRIGDTSSGNEMDVSAGRLGVEVVLNTFVADNLKQHLSYYEEVLILCIDDKKKREVERQIGNVILKRIQVDLLKNYFISL